MVNKKFGGGLGRDEIRERQAVFLLLFSYFFAFSQLTNYTDNEDTKARRRV